VSSGDLTTTSYAILGLLAIKPWTTYELTLQMDRSLNRIWPRARSRLYEEPKKLAVHKLASSRKEMVGRRPRTVYSITPKGRRVLAAWLAEPADGPVLENEIALKLFFAEHGTKHDALERVADARRWAEAELQAHVDRARDYVEGRAPFPERVAVHSIIGRFFVDFADMFARWADWATDQIERWPDDPAEAEPDWSVMREVARRGLDEDSS
jgi:DNA-binding PadR family transcriptional regulator